MNSCVLPTLIYGAQTWATTKKEENKLRVTQNTMGRSILGIKRKDKVKISMIKRKLNNNTNNFRYAAKRLKWDWTGHVARQDSHRWAWKAKNWYNREGRNRGKQKMRWENDIVKFLGNYKPYHRVARRQAGMGETEGGLCPTPGYVGKYITLLYL